ncbi:MAG: ABC transporter permease [Actinobacteria bacterium]|nr:ABC transporter permease [Actinomycetota bacterium]MCL5025732.1 ABC transporter permease [Chloroflexota bacterium]
MAVRVEAVELTFSEKLNRFWVGQIKFWQRVNKTRLAGFGIFTTIVVILLAITADFISPYDPFYQDYSVVLAGPSSAHLLGVDDLGRDILSRIIHGSRVSLEVGIIAVGVGAGVGVILGLISGWFGGALDEIIMRAMDAVWSFPALVLALAITAALGPSIGNAMIAIGVTLMPYFSRLTRGSALSIKERDFVMAGRVIGASDMRMILLYILPNALAPVIVQASLNIAGAILTEAALSFLGLGVRPPTPSWGGMLRVGYQYMEVAPWLAVFPGIAIFFTVLGFNFFGDGLRMALDPRLWQRGTA